MAGRSMRTEGIIGLAGIFVGMLLVLGAGAWLLSHTRNDIQTWLLSTQWRRVPPGESDIPAICPDAQIEKKGYMALTAQGGAHV
ncbi:hypothetical protein ACFEY4_004301 [Enterobacter asburiae]|uniref:hypothetical protein n=2 Tax=Enterobacter asburiae TaxID=61645 RepID=UPI0006D13D09|nr:hypothetical protein [Enterobacter asburiae]QLO49592.1 hypothetical protein HV216_22650 [Enterobacter cloacae]QLR30826.1 hypothetical protein HV349_22070 [Enterobacter asburiae]QPS68711.1 hypothetical protein I6G49_04955 [Enterobacter asburiae]